MTNQNKGFQKFVVKYFAIAKYYASTVNIK